MLVESSVLQHVHLSWATVYQENIKPCCESLIGCRWCHMFKRSSLRKLKVIKRRYETRTQWPACWRSAGSNRANTHRQPQVTERELNLVIRQQDDGSDLKGNRLVTAHKDMFILQKHRILHIWQLSHYIYHLSVSNYKPVIKQNAESYLHQTPTSRLSQLSSQE